MSLLASIIIPTYNRSNLLLRAMDSVKNQSHRPIEVIVVDDGSTDNTADLVSEWSRRNITECLKVHYFYKDNGGPSSCRNIGLTHAQGDFIYFLDSDDYMHCDLLSRTIDTIITDNSDCVIFGFDYIKTNGTSGNYSPPSEIRAIEAFLLGKLWGYTYTILRRSKLSDEVGLWNESMRIAEDYEYLGRTLFSSNRISVINESLITVTQGEDSLGTEKDTKSGLTDRLLAEKTIVSLLNSRCDISKTLQKKYANRLFKSAIRMYAINNINYASKLGDLAGEVNCGRLNYQDVVRRFVWRQGRWLCLVWYKLARIYSTLR